VVDRPGSQRAAGTVRNTWAALAALYAWLLPRNDDMVDPIEGFKMPKSGKPRPVPLFARRFRS
jgi:hypothetical protein